MIDLDKALDPIDETVRFDGLTDLPRYNTGRGGTSGRLESLMSGYKHPNNVNDHTTQAKIREKENTTFYGGLDTRGEDLSHH